MMQRYRITTREEYEECRKHGIEPMRSPYFEVEIGLRRELQEEIFGRGNKEKNNIKFYRYAYEIAEPKRCEECGCPLEQYSSVWISHICSRGAYPEFAFDLRNFNLLCHKHHSQWESPLERERMRIYEKNLETIEELKEDYYDFE